MQLWAGGDGVGLLPSGEVTAAKADAVVALEPAQEELWSRAAELTQVRHVYEGA